MHIYTHAHAHAHTPSVVPSFSRLTKLQHINIAQCRLTGTVPSFRGLRDLNVCCSFGFLLDSLLLFLRQVLALGGNQLHGTIPHFDDCLELTTIDLEANNLT